MFLDDLLKLADAQESTISVASTSYIDTIAKGDAYVGAFMYARVDTAFTAGAGEPNAMFSIQTASDTAFTTDLKTIASSGTYLASALTIGTEVKLRLGVPAERYVRGYMTVAVADGSSISDTHKFGAGKFDMFLVLDVDVQNSVA
jgi:hypothetical protein